MSDIAVFDFYVALFRRRCRSGLIFQLVTFVGNRNRLTGEIYSAVGRSVRRAELQLLGGHQRIFVLAYQRDPAGLDRSGQVITRLLAGVWHLNRKF